MKKSYYLSIVLLLSIQFFSCEHPQSQSIRTTSINNHPKNSPNYWKAEGYQVFDKYELALKAPIRLNNVNHQSKGNFDLHFSEFDGNRRNNKGTYYEIIVFKIPDYSQYSGVSQAEYEKNFLSSHLEKQGGQEHTISLHSGNIEGNLVNYLEQGRNAKAFAFIREGNLFTINVISDHPVNPLFEKFINSLIFYKDLSMPEGSEDLAKEQDAEPTTSPKAVRNNTLQYYDNTMHQFSIGYPRNWKQVSFQGVVFAAMDERTNNNFNVVVISNERRSLENVTKANQAELKRNLPGLRIIDQDKGVINGKSFTSTESQVHNPAIQGMQYIKTYCFVENSKAYIVTFGSAYAGRGDFTPIINEIIKSIEL